MKILRPTDRKKNGRTKLLSDSETVVRGKKSVGQSQLLTLPFFTRTNERPVNRVVPLNSETQILNFAPCASFARRYPRETLSAGISRREIVYAGGRLAHLHALAKVIEPGLP